MQLIPFITKEEKEKIMNAEEEVFDDDMCSLVDCRKMDLCEQCPLCYFSALADLQEAIKKGEIKVEGE